MKTSALIFSFITVLLLTVVSVSAQTKSTIIIKSMTIQNGDTIVKEQTYNNDGNTMIYDSLFDNNSRFLFFDKNYKLDTNFSDNFSEGFGREMEDFLKKFNYPSDNLFGQDFDIFGKGLQFDMDSIFSNAFPPNVFQGDSDAEIYEPPQKQVWYPYTINCENMVSLQNPTLSDYSTEPDPLNGSLKFSFSLDEEKPTSICIMNSNNKTIYKEKLPKSKGLYTRLFDLSVYEPGVYDLTITQGKKQNKSRLTFSKNR